MVIKGNPRGRPAELAKHLQRTDTNEQVTVLELRGVAAQDLGGALREMDALGAGLKTSRTLYHASINALASDYVPASMVEAAFMAGDVAGISLPQAVALVTDRPAKMSGLNDRGRIAPGMRADLVRVRVHEGMPVVRQVWRAGERVA